MLAVSTLGWVVIGAAAWLVVAIGLAVLFVRYMEPTPAEKQASAEVARRLALERARGDGAR